MLYISINKPFPDEIKAPDIWVNFNKSIVNQWLKDDFVKQMILDVDKTIVREDLSIYSPYLGVIPVDSLSTGVKNFMIAYGTSFPIDASKCGDNCAKWICKIAKMKDLKVALYHIMVFPSNLQAVITNYDVNVNNYAEYHDIISDYFLNLDEEDD
jgi:hypothetical protein